MRIIFSVFKSKRLFWRYIGGIVCVCFFVVSCVVTPFSADAAQTESAAAGNPIVRVYHEVIRQMSGVAAFTAQAIGAVMASTVVVDEAQIAAAKLEPVIETPLRSVQFPLAGVGVGTFIVNAPLSVTNSLTATGESRLASTTVSGSLTVDTLTVFGVAQIQSLQVAGRTTTGELQVAGTAAAANLSIADRAEIAQLLVQGTSDLGGLLEARGGIVTSGADIQLGTGSLFASNVVNEVIAGTNVTVTGSSTAPIISFTPEPFDGVTDINGRTGSISLDGGTDISISGMTIRNTSSLFSVRARGGCADCITDTDVVNSLTLAGATIDATVIGSSSAAAAFFTTVTVGTSSATTSLFSVLGNATSTFGGSINLESGCFSIQGTCVTASAPPSYLSLDDTPGAYLASAIQFANASATALSQSANFVFDGNNFGVGTSTPTARLTVEGDSLLVGTLTVLSATTSNFTGGIDVTDGCVSVNGICLGGVDQLANLNDVLLATTSADDILIYDGAQWINQSATTLGFGDGTFLGLSDTPSSFTADAIPFTGTSSLLFSGDFVFDGTNLGVGTSTPTARLTVDGATLLAGALTVDADISLAGQQTLRWYDVDSSNYVGFKSPATVVGDTVWTLPPADGGVDEILVTDGSGNLRFAAVSSVGGGSETYLGLLDTPNSFTNGAIPFVGTSSLLFSNNFIFDGLNFGVGLSTPTVPLSVQGDVRFQAADTSVGFVYSASSNFVGLGTENPVEKLTIENGSVLQRGGSGSSPYTPTVTGSLNLASNPNANDLQIVGNYAYVVSGAAGNDFHVVDITDPSAPAVVGSLGLPDAANAVFVRGNYAYVVSTVSGDDFHIIDISDPSLPVLIGGLNLPSTANDVYVEGNFAYVVTNNIGTDFHIINIASTTAPVQVGEMELPDSGTGVVVRNGYAYVTSESLGDDFQAIDVRDPALPVEVSAVNLPTSANDVTILGRYAFVVTSDAGDDFHIIDIANPSAVSEVASLDLNTTANAVSVAGSYAYVTTAGTGDDVHVIDIGAITAPVEVGSVDLEAGSGQNLQIVGTYAYIVTTNLGAELFVVDITGVESQSALVHSLEAGTLSVSNDTVIAGGLSLGRGLLVGSQGVQSDGPLLVASVESSSFTGSLGVGTTTPNSELTVDGVIQASNLFGGTTNLIVDAQGNIVRDVSDERLKTNITTVENSLEKVLGLRGVTYAWRDTERFGTAVEIGFIAQEVDLVVPEAVRKGGDYWSLNTRNLLAVVVEAIKEIWSTVQGNSNRIQELEARIQTLENSPVSTHNAAPSETISETPELNASDTIFVSPEVNSTETNPQASSTVLSVPTSTSTEQSIDTVVAPNAQKEDFVPVAPEVPEEEVVLQSEPESATTVPDTSSGSPLPLEKTDIPNVIPINQD